MKFTVSVLLTSLLIFAAGLYLPWWSLAIAALLVSICIPLRPLFAFLAGFLGLVICWSVIALVRDGANSGILSEKVAGIFPIGGSSFLLILISCVLGGLVSGFAAVSGSYFVYNRKQHK